MGFIPKSKLFLGKSKDFCIWETQGTVLDCLKNGLCVVRRAHWYRRNIHILKLFSILADSRDLDKFVKNYFI